MDSKRAKKVGDVIFTTIIKIFTGTEWLFYWVEKPCSQMTAAQERKVWRKFCATPAEQRHGPFSSPAECNKDRELVLLGPNVKITEGGAWDPAWERRDN